MRETAEIVPYLDNEESDDHTIPFATLLDYLRFPWILSYLGSFSMRGFSFPRDFFGVCFAAGGMMFVVVGRARGGRTLG